MVTVTNSHARRKNQPTLQVALGVVVLIGVYLYCYSGSEDDSGTPSLPQTGNAATPISATAAVTSKAPVTCGTQYEPECPRIYSLNDVRTSAAMGDDHPAVPAFRQQLEAARIAGKEACSTTGAVTLNTGGWCLVANRKRPAKVEYKTWSHRYPMGHVPPAQGIVTVLSDMIRGESIRSISDFGAGVGQYKAALLSQQPALTYYAYDGAGNGEEYTNGFLSYVDLTIPLFLPKTDWVMSLEVGEHIPYTAESNFIRNLHRHNCRGIVLSWGIPGQGGVSHVNLHANEYVISIFKGLDYEYDEKTSEKLRTGPVNSWFRKSVMVFRRRHNVCQQHNASQELMQ